MQSLPMPVLTDYPDAPVVETVDAAAQAEQDTVPHAWSSK